MREEERRGERERVRRGKGREDREREYLGGNRKIRRWKLFLV